MSHEYDIRLIRAAETGILRAMLGHAIFVAPGETPPRDSVLDLPELASIYASWGRPGDLALVAVGPPDHSGGDGEHQHRSIIGAAWYRLFRANAPGYGFVASDIPELAVAVLPEYRGEGIGTALLRALISRASSAGYRGISLSVDSRNPALRLYQRLGFAVVKSGQSPTMLLEFQSHQ